MMTTIRSVDTDLSYLFFFFSSLVRTFKLYSLSNFQVYNTILLTTITGFTPTRQPVVV